MGFGLHSRAKIRNQSKIINIPPRIWKPVSADHAYYTTKCYAPGFIDAIQVMQREMEDGMYDSMTLKSKDSLTKMICLASMVLVNLHQPEKGPYYAYFDLLNREGFVDINADPPICRVLQPCQGIPNDDSVLRLFSMGQSDISKSEEALSIIKRAHFYDKFSRVLFGEDVTAVRRFKWAMSQILSRAVSSSEYGWPLTFLPLVDLINHSFSPNVAIDYDSNSHEYYLTSLRDIKDNEEILLDYGNAKTNLELFHSYTFCVLGNKNEKMKLRLPELKHRNDNVLHSWKEKMIKKYQMGRDDIEDIVVYSGKSIDFVNNLHDFDPSRQSFPLVPIQVLIALRYYLMDEDDLKTMFGSAREEILHRLPTELENPIDATNEYKVLLFLSNAVKERIQQMKSRPIPSLENNIKEFDAAKTKIQLKRDSDEIWRLAGLTYAVTEQATWKATDVCFDKAIEKLRVLIFKLP